MTSMSWFAQATPRPGPQQPPVFPDFLHPQPHWHRRCSVLRESATASLEPTSPGRRLFFRAPPSSTTPLCVPCWDVPQGPPVVPPMSPGAHPLLCRPSRERRFLDDGATSAAEGGEEEEGAGGKGAHFALTRPPRAATAKTSSVCCASRSQLPELEAGGWLFHQVVLDPVDPPETSGTRVLRQAARCSRNLFLLQRPRRAGEDSPDCAGAQPRLQRGRCPKRARPQLSRRRTSPDARARMPQTTTRHAPVPPTRRGAASHG